MLSGVKSGPPCEEAGRNRVRQQTRTRNHWRRITEQSVAVCAKINQGMEMPHLPQVLHNVDNLGDAFPEAAL